MAAITTRLYEIYLACQHPRVKSATLVLRNLPFSKLIASIISLFDCDIFLFLRHEAELAAAASQPLPDDDDDTFE